MDQKTIDRIVWWIPFKQLRNDIRSYLNNIYDKINMLNNLQQAVAVLTDDNSYYKKRINELNDLLVKTISKENIIYPCVLSNIDFYFYDSITSKIVDIVKDEIEPYNFDKIDFKEGDIVIDIGANVGMVSIYLAKKYPFLKIYAFEPVKQNYENLLRNIQINNIPNGIITVENVAITKDRRDINIITPIYNTGGSTFAIQYNLTAILSNINLNIKSITFDDIFEKYNIDKCKLLKIDCEGAEYEILYSANVTNLKKISNMRGEFHGNVDKQKELYKYCYKYIKNLEYQEGGGKLK